MKMRLNSQEMYDEWGWFIDTESINSDNRHSTIHNQNVKKYNNFKVIKEEMDYDYDDEYSFYKKLYSISEEESICICDRNDKNDKKNKPLFKFYSKNIITTLFLTVIIYVSYNSFKLTSYTT